MKKFETPEIEISKFDVEDVITASGDDVIVDDGREDELPIG